MKFDIEKKHISMGITTFLVIVCSIIFYYLIFHWPSLLSRISSIIKIASPVVYGITFAYLLTPIVNSLESKYLQHLFQSGSEMTAKEKSKMRVTSVAITMILVVLALYAFFSILIPNLIESIANISVSFPIYINNLNGYVNKYLEANPDVERAVTQLINTYSNELNQYVNTTILPQMQNLVKTVSLSMLSVFKVLWNLIIGLIISIYVLFSKETFASQSKKIVYALFSVKNGNDLIRGARFVSNTFIGFISGKIIDSAIIGVLCFIGTSALKIPYALLVSVIVGVTNIIPFFGPYIGAIPSAILILMVSPIKCLTFLIFILILQQIDGNIIGPKIIGQSTGLSGFWVIFSITIFGGLFGILGMIIGVPFFAVIYAMVRKVINRKLKRKNMPVASETYRDVKYIDKNDYHFVPLEKEEKEPFFKLFRKSGRATRKKNEEEAQKDSPDQDSSTK